jgi:transposase
MRKLKIKDAEIIRIAVQQEIIRSEEARYDHRLHGILLVCSGLSCAKVAELFGHGPRTIQYWVRRFEEHGFAGLQDIPRPGRPSVMDNDVRNGISADLRHSPRQFGYSQNLWDSKLLSHHLTKKYRVDLGERQCRRIFHQLGFRRRKPRPLIAKSDKEAQAAYKKT